MAPVRRAGACCPWRGCGAGSPRPPRTAGARSLRSRGPSSWRCSSDRRGYAATPSGACSGASGAVGAGLCAAVFEATQEDATQACGAEATEEDAVSRLHCQGHGLAVGFRDFGEGVHPIVQVRRVLHHGQIPERPLRMHKIPPHPAVGQSLAVPRKRPGERTSRGVGVAGRRVAIGRKVQRDEVALGSVTRSAAKVGSP